jgi:alpha-galactosidase/6-phospho-beta-glucosidase family protein
VKSIPFDAELDAEKGYLVVFDLFCFYPGRNCNFWGTDEILQEQQEFLRKFTLELASDYDSTMSDHDDLSKENDQQTKTIRHLQTRIKLLEKSQNDSYKTTNQIERENKTLKSQIEERNNEIKSLKSERRKDKNDFENKLKIKLNEIEQQYVRQQIDFIIFLFISFV